MKKLIYIVIAVLLIGASSNVLAQGCQSPHNTIMNFNNGQDGNMFNVTALKNIYLDSLWGNFDAGTIQEVEIWYRSGTVVGFANAATGWTLIDSVLNVTSAGTNNFTKPGIWMNLFVPVNNTVGIYFTRAWLANVGPYMRYTNGPFGSTAGQFYNSNNDLEVSYAFGKDYPFATSFNPRIWNGRIFYRCCPPPPTPQISSAPTQICSSDTFTYSITPYAFATSYQWTAGNSGSIVGVNSDSTEVQIVFNGTAVFDTICIQMTDTCEVSDTCIAVVINPPTADAGPDTTICSTTYQLNGNAASGSWSVVGGSGTFADPNLYNTVVSGLSPGVNVLEWKVANANCDTIIDNVNIVVNPIPVAQYDPPNGCAGTNVQFTDNSYALGGNLISWAWDVDGDGSTDYTTNSFNHAYSSPGTYQARLIVTANGGCTDTVIHDIVVAPNPNVDFEYDPDCEGNPMSFTDLTTISSGNLVSWQWEYGDGNSSGGQNPLHIYAVDGVYLVTLTVTSDSGCEASHTDSVEVFSIPDVDFYAQEVCQNDTVFFQDTSISDQGTINYWEWDFGDGAPVDYNQNTAHMYLAHDLYNVRLTVATDRGCTNTVVKPHRSFPVPVPDFTQDGQCERQRVLFYDNTSLDTMFNSSLVDWHWEFGDGNDAYGDDAGYFYQDPGYFTLGLTPYTNYGCHTTLETEILMRPKPDANILVLDDEVCAGNEIHYRDEHYFDYEFDSAGVVSWQWQFGDGDESFEENPSNVYDKGGVYSTLMIVETQYGCIDSTRSKTVIYHVPEADFSIDTLEGCSPHCVTFIDQSKLGSGEDLRYAWDFGNGDTNLQDVNPTYCYSVEDGTGTHKFPIRLAVTSPNGCVDTVRSQSQVVVYSNPIADFDLSDIRLSFLEPVVYVDNYSVDADYWNWDFGDSTFSAVSNPVQHVYEQPGEYTIELMVANDFGCEDIMRKALIVERHQTIFIPNSFTPNGDGRNEFFEIVGEDLEYVKLWVFDRWGNELFYGENDQARWDGTYNGESLPIGSYAYVVEYRQVNQIKQVKRGNFVLSKSNDK